MRDKYFIDTNIFVYSFDTIATEKQKIARKLIHEALQEQTGFISFQVIQEFMNVSSQRFDPPLAIPDSLQYLDAVLTPLCEVFASIDLYKKSLEIFERWKFSFYDSLIIAAALQIDCSILYSEDLQHDQKIQSLAIKNPFISISKNKTHLGREPNSIFVKR
ncbi:MAG: PIN domain-containing protein [Deltaproteobacteria bacterium]|nr:PIN domain-containing protein [Deltaproteobacteria bacterium]